jgi:hypothetical protein
MSPATQLSVRQLSERAQILIHQMLDRHAAADSIARTIRSTTHEPVSAEAITRYTKIYAAKVQAKENARQRTAHLVGEIIQHGVEVSDMLRAAFQESFARAKKTGALPEMNPLLFEAAERRRLELDLRKKQVSLAERRVQVFEDRLYLDRKKAQAAIAQLDRKARRGVSVTAKEVDRIRQLYGIFESTDRQASAEERHVRRAEVLS